MGWFSRFLIPLAGLLCLAPFMGASAALILGAGIALVFGNPYLARLRKLPSSLLAVAIVGLGAGMDLRVIMGAGFSGIGLTALSITCVLVAGYGLGRLFNVPKRISLLISAGTAICGGSAIAAIAPVLRAKPHEITAALAVVFILNALALIIFPPIGHFFGLSQEQFGLWSALAIHDTSSVVGASLQYGEEALETGTTIKLVRALWIIPVALAIGLFNKPDDMEDGKEDGPQVKAKIPWFILGFILMAALVTFVPALQGAGAVLSDLAKRLLVLTLFLIGASLTRESLQEAGFAPYVQGITLWLLTAIISLGGLLFFSAI